MQNWIIEQTDEGGIIRHGNPPRFSARWTSGDEVKEIFTIEDPCFTDEGSEGGADAIHIFGFQWTIQPPQQVEFKKLMKEAVRQIDNFISRSL